MSDGKTGADRRAVLGMGAAVAATLAAPAIAKPAIAKAGSTDLGRIRAEIDKRQDEAVQRLRSWIALPGIAAENRNMPEACDMTMRMLSDAGFQHVEKVPTDGHPGIFATLDAGAKKTMALYFMYDVKQYDPAEWSSPPLAGAIVDRPGLGKVMIGRGAVNQKGPEATFLAALHAIRAAGQKLPVNLVLVAEGEEEIGSPHFHQVVQRPDIAAALKRCREVYMPFASQNPSDGGVTVYLGAKGVVEMELISSGARWGRGPEKDIHSSEKARLDSPAWHLVKALSTLVSEDGNDIAIPGYAAKARSLSPTEKAMIAEVARRTNEAGAMKQMGVKHWVHDLDWQGALERLASVPTINIEGLVGGYTGVGGKTILPGKATAKLDLRLVPDMTAAEAAQAVRAHLDRNGFADIEMKVSGGYDPTSTPADSALIRTEIEVYRKNGIDPVILPRLAGSWPGYVFTGAPLNMPAGHFGLGHGNGAHAPDEYYLIESSNPKVQGMAGAAYSHVEFLWALAAAK